MVLVRVIRPHTGTLCWIKTFLAKNEEEAMKTVGEMDTEGVSKIQIFELKKTIELET